jgi:hypothetical protein
MGEGKGGGDEKEFGPPSPSSPPARGGEILGVFSKCEKKILRFKSVRI